MTIATPINGLPYMGQDAPNPRNTFYRRRAPGNSDRRLYKVGDRWIDTTNQIAYILLGKTATTANWQQISGMAGVTSLNTLVGALSIIDEGGAGAIQVTVPGSGGPLTIGLGVKVDGVTVMIVGDQLVATAGASQFTVDAFTAPGTNPVVPLAGNLGISADAVAPVGIPAQTHSIAANSFEVQIQRTSASLLTDTISQGLASFDSLDFNVDINGFVSLTATSGVTWHDTPAPFGANAANGYFVSAAGIVQLPPGLLGDTVEIVDRIGGGVIVTGAPGETIRIGNTISSAGGTATSTQFGDALRLVYSASEVGWLSVPSTAGVWILA